MSGRKIGVGFNQPLVLGGRLQHDHKSFREMVRRIFLAHRAPNLAKRWWRPAASLVDTMREYRQ